MKMKKLIVLLFTSLLSLNVCARDCGPKWLEKAVFYQIYPSSYMDTDGNGIGDLRGIILRLDYIQSLGVNALWLNPIFESGWFDGGYDVIDFYKVDPRFGTNSDVVTLVREAHKRGIKVCLDLVAGHTSDKCAWFRESMGKDRNLRYSDYYIWTDSISDQDREDIELRKQDPNPASSTRGKFVDMEAPRARYYLKNYFACQPALNYGYAHPDPNHPWEQSVDAPGPQAVRREMRNIMAFWLDKGIDGFRVDMAQSLVKNDYDGSELKKLWTEMRQWKDKYYPECVLISEWSRPTEAIPDGFNIDFMMHFGIPGYPSLFFAKDTPFGERHSYPYCYFDKSGKGIVKEFIENFSEAYAKTRSLGYIALPTANHDFQRMNIGTRNTPDQLKVAFTFLLTMPCIPFIYYGDEIGMISQRDLPSKEGSNERSGNRTPMQWTPGPTAGFSTCRPEQLYFPVATDGGRITVSEEERDKHSVLNFVRSLVTLRQSSAALGNTGDWRLLSDVDKPYPLVYQRSAGDETYIIAVNPSSASVRVNLPAISFCKGNTVSLVGKASCKPEKGSLDIRMGGVSAAVFKLRD